MKNNRMKDAFEKIAQRSVPENTNLWPNILVRLDERKSLMQTMRARPLLIIVIAILVLLALSGVAYAISKSPGYILGVGIVNQSTPIRVLAEPVTVQRNKTTLTVKLMVADSTQTFLIYQMRGVPALIYEPMPCAAAPRLQLPDGSILEAKSGGIENATISEFGVGRFDGRFLYPPLPAEVKQVIVLPVCELPALSVALVVALPGIVSPATEFVPTFSASRPVLPTPTPYASQTEELVYPTDFASTLTPVPNGSGLYLEQAVELENAYLLIGNFTNSGDLPGDYWQGYEVPYDLRVSDRDGKPVLFHLRPELMPKSPWSNVTYWALEIPKPVNVPLTLTLPQITLSNFETFEFPLDVGESPFIGQTWQLNRTIQTSGYRFLVENIQRSERGYTLTLHSLDPISRENFYGNLNVKDVFATSILERSHERDGLLELSETLTFPSNVPTGKITFVLQIAIETQVGPWTLTWSPPSAP